MPTPNSSAVMLFIEPTIVCLRVWALLLKANKSLFMFRLIQYEGFSQGEVDRLFGAFVLPNFTCGLSFTLP